METQCSINVSQTNKTILWLWSKTGTSLASNIFSDFGFDSFDIKEQELIPRSSGITQFHNCCLFKGHEEYSLVVTVRNPYSRFFSDFRHNRMDIPTEEQFRTYLEYEVYKKKNQNCYGFLEREPDYPVRLENLFEDYSSIPFLKNSELYTSGKLLEMCGKKVNQNKKPLNWRDFYTKNLADMVYYSCQNYFEIFGYEKDSWKK